MAHALPALSLLETRVLGTLIEKEHTVPDTYPLSLNALVSGCGQKTSRNPVIETTDAEVQAVLDNLKRYNLVVETSGGRVARYAHNFGRVLQVPSQSEALLAVLMLRGPQTPGELRINSERLHHFADISAVEAFLNELAARATGALVAELPRLAGARENRWAHTLSGLPSVAPAQSVTATPTPAAEPSLGELAALKANVARLESDVRALQDLVGKLCAEIGFSR